MSSRRDIRQKRNQRTCLMSSHSPHSEQFESQTDPHRHRTAHVYARLVRRPCKIALALRTIHTFGRVYRAQNTATLIWVLERNIKRDDALGLREPLDKYRWFIIRYGGRSCSIRGVVTRNPRMRHLLSLFINIKYYVVVFINI